MAWPAICCGSQSLSRPENNKADLDFRRTPILAVTGSDAVDSWHFLRTAAAAFVDAQTCHGVAH